MLCSTVLASSPYQNVMLGFVISLGVGRKVGSECWQTFPAQHHFAAILISVPQNIKPATMVFLEIFWSLFHETGLFWTHELCSLHPNSMHWGLELLCWNLYCTGRGGELMRHDEYPRWPDILYISVHSYVQLQQWSPMLRCIKLQRILKRCQNKSSMYHFLWRRQ